MPIEDDKSRSHKAPESRRFISDIRLPVDRHKPIVGLTLPSYKASGAVGDAPSVSHPIASEKPKRRRFFTKKRLILAIVVILLLGGARVGGKFVYNALK